MLKLFNESMFYCNLENGIVDMFDCLSDVLEIFEYTPIVYWLWPNDSNSDVVILKTKVEVV